MPKNVSYGTLSVQSAHEIHFHIIHERTWSILMFRTAVATQPLRDMQSIVHIICSSTLLCRQRMPHGRGSSQANRLDQKRVHDHDKIDWGFCSGLCQSAMLLLLVTISNILSNDMGCAGWREKREVRSRKRINDFGMVVPHRIEKISFAHFDQLGFNHLWVCINNEVRQGLGHFPHCPSNNQTTSVWFLA